ncbi:hypothetical protein I6F09_36705 [Bradyrhizobium sp. IC3195]|uniref:hypothetical protein n=1 Tax=Bradyrhizobium sp. IC3195 TaxID=2793804 RepID=UPI001CD6817A|nr:hypothetical protein [Bradyrhizobium sp. IC3195]MCA1473355.1 hypothetical protein [Bradyrhizobium sp. IC3195]
MELKMLDGLTIGSVLAGVLGTLAVVWLEKMTALAKGHRTLGRLLFLASNKFLWRLIAAAFISVLTAWVLSATAPALGFQVSTPLAALIIFGLLSISLQWRFSNIGIHSAQSSVASGTNYSSALSLCRDNFSFLGTGAYKLVSEPRFKETLLRCNDSQNPIRLLLSSPDNPLIRQAEQRAGVAPGTYRHNLISSLKMLSELRKERSAKFEVRFYKSETERDFENFRMMFIDDDVLLLSYNIYGNRDTGRNTPQLVLFKSSMKSSAGGFYAAFRGYFERLWNSSEPWDFHDYV